MTFIYIIKLFSYYIQITKILENANWIIYEEAHKIYFLRIPCDLRMQSLETRKRERLVLRCNW